MDMAKMFESAQLSSQEKKLMQQIVQNMMAPPGSQQAAADSAKELHAAIRNIAKKPRISEPIRLMGVQFLVMFHTMEAMKLGQAMAKSGSQALDDPKVVAFRNAQKADMETCWHLLTFESDIKEAVQAAQLLKVDVAQRLESSTMLNEVFQEMTGGVIMKMPMQQAMVAFTAAPMLGQWQKFALIGARLVQLQGSLEQFHVMSQQMPVPDFEVLHRMANNAKLRELAAPAPEECLWETFEVKKIRVKFQDVRCEGFEEKEAEIRAQITENDSDKWEEVPNTEQIQIKRMGAIVQTMSFGEVPMQVVGPWEPNRMHVKGYTEIMMTGNDMSPQEQQALQMQIMSGQVDPKSLPMIRQSEMWDLTRDAENPNLFKGVYTLDQTPLLSEEDKKKANADQAPIKMSFDCEMEINQVEGGLHGGDSTNGAASADTPANDDEKTGDAQITTDIDGLTLD